MPADLYFIDQYLDFLNVSYTSLRESVEALRVDPHTKVSLVGGDTTYDLSVEDGKLTVSKGGEYVMQIS